LLLVCVNGGQKTMYICENCGEEYSDNYVKKKQIENCPECGGELKYQKMAFER
jgi:DNA-directed RNA polymerase subunit RPC12/RpoP